jgi:1,2-phenylacetyl-CoA epoxidase catalytic subunit
MTPREFTDRLLEQCEPMFRQGEQNVTTFFDKKPNKSALIEYFSRRMINERVNCVQIAKVVANLPLNSPAEEMFLLSKQVMDEAKHYRYVREIVEELLGKEIDVDLYYHDMRERQLRGELPGSVPARLLEQYECSKNPLTLALYQFIAEGVAYRNWTRQAEVAPTEHIRSRYEEIAKDEKFHSQMGRSALEKLLVDSETMEKAQQLANEIIDALSVIGCANQHIPMSELFYKEAA